MATWLQNLEFFFSYLRFQDLIDLILVWLVVYRVLMLAKKSGAVQILSGLGILAIAHLVSSQLELYTFHWLLNKFFSNLFLIVVILFQAEIRRALAQLGSNPFFSHVSSLEEAHVIEEVSKAAIAIAQKGMGALIVIERDITLDYFIEIGTRLDAVPKAETMMAIFQPNSPIHDGALIIRSGRMFAAGCFLPLSKNPALDKNLGTRHRAAIGLTEETDAFVIVVSEENKSVGIVQGGLLTSDLDHAGLRQKLYETFEVKMRVEAPST